MDLDDFVRGPQPHRPTAAYVEAIGRDAMDYRGAKIRLSKKYVDYDDYKNDPANLVASDISRVEKLMTDAQVGPDFANWHEAADRLINIKFPGYGMASGANVVAAGREFAVRFIEIPQVAKERYCRCLRRPRRRFGAHAERNRYGTDL